MGRVVAHLDLDAFFAAVEVLERPELAGLPLVVGGNPDGRGVVATASYEARHFGVRSAMSAAEARRRCPQAVFVRPDHGALPRASRAASGRLVGERCPAVEQVGIDEGYLDLTARSSTSSGGAAVPDAACRTRSASATGLSASFGCGTSKVVAKIASDHAQAGRRHGGGGGRARRRSWRRCRCARCPASGRSRTSAAAGARACATIGDLAALRTTTLARAPARRRRRTSCATGPAASTRGRSCVEPAAHVSIGYEETFDDDVASAGAAAARGAAHERAGGGAAGARRPPGAHRHGQGALPGLPAAQPLARRRPPASSGPDEIGELAVQALDARARATGRRPCGCSASRSRGSACERQLELDAPEVT